ncbi:MAG TPA: dihydrofolate reductase family protein [Vicinamibacterales bacterium]
MGRRLRYQVAASLDGFIAGPEGEYDWIVNDPGVDFDALFKEFDTLVMGRKTYEMMTAQGGDGGVNGKDVVVFSRTLPAKSTPGLRIVNDEPAGIIKALKAKKGRDIWLFGGGELFRSLLDLGVVDTVEVAVMPVLIGSGIPLVPAGSLAKLKYSGHKVLPDSGIVVVSYRVAGSRAAAQPIRYIRDTPARATARRGTKTPPKKKATPKRRRR